MEEIAYQAAFGAFSGFALGLTSYLKAQHPDGSHEGFDGFRLAKTAAVGAVVGGGAAVMGITPEVFIALPIYGGITIAVENILKAILRKIS